MPLRLIIGNKNYSSWSMRPWIAMKVAGIAFEETVISLYVPGSKAQIAEVTPAGKVPVLIDGDVQVWESLAILEYLAERIPQAALLPQDPQARAHARAIASEMHAGFAALRRACPMNMRRSPKPIAINAEVQANVARIGAMWEDCRARFGAGGPFLFGPFSAADAMYAPVVARLWTYALPVGTAARAYMDAVLNLPAWKEWQAAAVSEPWVLPQFELE